MDFDELDEVQRKVCADVATYGWSAINVLGTDHTAPFQYSIGFYHTFGHPEILITGLPTATMHAMLTAIASGLQAGRRYDEGLPATDLLHGYDCLFTPVPLDRLPIYFGEAHRYYCEEPFPALQCVWPDRDGRFPWDPEFDESLKQQEPILHPG